MKRGRPRGDWSQMTHLERVVVKALCARLDVPLHLVVTGLPWWRQVLSRLRRYEP